MAVPVPSSLAGRSRAASVARTRLLLVVNPHATRAGGPRLGEAERALRGAFDVTVVHTEGRGHAAELARDAAEEGYPVVVAAGGDGTFSETAQGLAGSDTAMACVPSGLTNVFARALGSPREPVQAALQLAALERDGRLGSRRIDLGTVNGRHFVFTSGVGLSASMTAAGDATPSKKARFGQLHFAAAAASALAGRYLRDPPRMRVHAGGRTAEGVTLVVQNARALTYFGPREIQACHAAGLDSGGISLTLLRRARTRDVPPVLLRLLAQRVPGHPAVDSFGSIPRAVVESADGRPLPLEADGEFLGEHQRIEYAVDPGALRVVVSEEP